MFKWQKIINDIFTTFVATNITLHWPNVQENSYIHGVQKLLKPQIERSRTRKLKCQVYCGQQCVLELMWHHVTDCYRGNCIQVTGNTRSPTLNAIIDLFELYVSDDYTPVQWIPSPVYPGLQTHLYPPSRLWQVACAPQISDSHSSTSTQSTQHIATSVMPTVVAIHDTSDYG